MTKIYKTLKQNSPEWLNIRLGKFTASDFHTFLGKSKTRTTAIYKKAAERLTKSRCDQDAKIGGIHIERGNILEPLARECYERKMNCEVEEIGFIEMSDTVGFSPDGFVGKNKILEIKCMDNHTYLNSIKTEVCPEHYTQLQFGLMVTGRDSADYVIYNPKFNKPLFVRNIKRDEEHIEKIKEALCRAEKEIEEILDIYYNNF
jgi:putative phage-type endonuclease